MAFVEITYAQVAMGAAGARYAVFCDGEKIADKVREPLHDGARALIAGGGFDADDTLIMLGADGRPSLTARLGWAAAHTVSEGASFGPRTTKWEPYYGPESDE